MPHLLLINCILIGNKYFRAEDPDEDEEKGIFGKIFHYIIGLPCTIIRNISIPPSTEENWSRTRATVWPLPVLLVLCVFFECILHSYY